MATTFTKQYTIIASSPKYGVATISITLSFDNESNTSVLTFDDYQVGGQTSGYTPEGAIANSKANNSTIKLYSLKALTKLGTNHIYIYKNDESEFNKQTRYVCDLTFLAITIKEDVYKWRKDNEKGEE